jgi:hypothetical protein
MVHAEGISPLQDRVKAVKEFPKPMTVVEMQAFLGLYNYYRRLLKPLTDALQGKLKPTSKLEWTGAMDAAFTAAKSALSAATLLDHPSPAAEIYAGDRRLWETCRSRLTATPRPAGLAGLRFFLSEAE